MKIFPKLSCYSSPFRMSPQKKKHTTTTKMHRSYEHLWEIIFVFSFSQHSKIHIKHPKATKQNFFMCFFVAAAAAPTYIHGEQIIWLVIFTMILTRCSLGPEQRFPEVIFLIIIKCKQQVIFFLSSFSFFYITFYLLLLLFYLCINIFIFDCVIFLV